MDRIQLSLTWAAVMCFCFLFQVAGAGADVDIEQHLNSNYRDKTFLIRGFYTGNHLKYDSRGEPVGNPHTGYWSVDGEVQIRKIKLSGSRLQIQAERLFLDIASEQVLAFRHGNDWVDFNVELDPQHVQAGDVDALLTKIFHTEHDNLLDLVPDYWKPCLNSALGGATTKEPGCRFRSSVGIPLSAQLSSSSTDSYQTRSKTQPEADERQEQIHHASEKGLVPPHPIRRPDAEFSEQARSLHATGIVTLTLVVDQSGDARGIRIAHARGLGLDERAVEKVKTWKFVPASKDGKPVNVEIAVEMNFHYE
jgi:TonB family protein